MSKLTEEQNVPESSVVDRIWTIPNLISLIRFLLIPLFFYFFVIVRDNTIGCILFAVAAGTDWVDGQVARKTGQVSNLGKVLDPAVDRVLLAVGVISIWLVGRLPLWLMILVFARDIVLGILALWLKKRHGEQLTVIYLGKVATALLMVGFASLVLAWPVAPGLGLFELAAFPGFGAAAFPVGIWFAYVGIVLSWATGIIYLYRGIRYGSTKKHRDE